MKERFADTKQNYASVAQIFDGLENEPPIPGLHQSFKRTQQDYQFIFGDMNFRCDLTNFSAKELARNNDVRALVAADQLLVAKNTDDLLYRFHEEQITFLPTFKYDKNSEEYDTSKK